MARSMLIEKLDLFLNDETSKVGLRTAKLQKAKDKIVYRQKQNSTKREVRDAEEPTLVKDGYQHKPRLTKSQVRKELRKELFFSDSDADSEAEADV